MALEHSLNMKMRHSGYPVRETLPVEGGGGGG